MYFMFLNYSSLFALYSTLKLILYAFITLVENTYMNNLFFFIA